MLRRLLNKKQICILNNQRLLLSTNAMLLKYHTGNDKNKNLSDIQLKQQQQHQIVDSHKLKEGEKLMQKTYEQVQVKSFSGKAFTNLTQLQKQIVTENKFDLSNPQIKPKMTTLNSIPGLEKSEEITQIDLGQVKIKNKNQVFLSEVDPYNIPEDFQIRFDTEKRLTLVGRKIKSNQNIIQSQKNSKIMHISTTQSFQQKTLSQLSEKHFGQIGYKYQFNRKQTYRQFLLVIPLIWLIIYPILTTLRQSYDCIQSIRQIEQEEWKEIKALKKSQTVKVLLDNKDFNNIL